MSAAKQTQDIMCVAVYICIIFVSPSVCRCLHTLILHVLSVTVTSEDHNHQSVSETKHNKVSAVLLLLLFLCYFIILSSLTQQVCVCSGVPAGQCACKEGFEGRQCDRCAFGYRDFPQCVPCECNLSGSTNTDPCSPCTCKVSCNISGMGCLKFH